MTRPSIIEHIRHVLSVITPDPPVVLPLGEAIGCVLATDLHARRAVPPFSNSGMDGFLIHEADLSADGPTTLPVGGDVPAGGSALTPAPGTAVRIMTGAPVADPIIPGLVVIPVEDTSAQPGPHDLPELITINSYHGRSHIRPRGDNMEVGDRVAEAGELIDAGMLAGLISAGVAEVTVFPRPTVSVLSSGDELIDAHTTPQPGQIPDSNKPMVAALLRESGIDEVLELHAGDDPREFSATFLDAVENSNLVITTGGVSAGAFDVVKEVINAGDTGSDMWFGHIAMQPGKPQGVGTWTRTDGSTAAVLCLPGNPVAAFVSFLLFVQPAIRKLRGWATDAELSTRPRITASAGADFPDARGRDLVIPVRLAWNASGATAIPFTSRGRGSHFVASLNGINGFTVIPTGGTGPRRGADILVYLI